MYFKTHEGNCSSQPDKQGLAEQLVHQEKQKILNNMIIQISILKIRSVLRVLGMYNFEGNPDSRVERRRGILTLLSPRVTIDSLWHDWFWSFQIYTTLKCQHLKKKRKKKDKTEKAFRSIGCAMNNNIYGFMKI